MGRLQSQEEEEIAVALSRSFRETVAERAHRDPEFRAALYQEAMDAFIEGDMDGFRALLRDFINATIGFEKLSAETHLPTKSLMRMVGRNGNPSINNLASILSAARKSAGIKAHVEVSAVTRTGRRPRASHAGAQP